MEKVINIFLSGFEGFSRVSCMTASDFETDNFDKDVRCVSRDRQRRNQDRWYKTTKEKINERESLVYFLSNVKYAKPFTRDIQCHAFKSYIDKMYFYANKRSRNNGSASTTMFLC